MEKIIRVITLYQPWATLLAHGIKMNETRPRPTTHTAEKGIYLIHAAKKYVPVSQWSKEINNAIFNRKFNVSYTDEDIEKCLMIKELPLGYIIGSFEVKECKEVFKDVSKINYTVKAIVGIWDPIYIKEPEFSFGDYSDGRSIWIGQNHRVLKNPIPYRGQQGYYAKFKGDINQLKFL